MQDYKYSEQREWFERWLTMQFKNLDESKLKKDSDLSYVDLTINSMFMAFCAAWAIK